MTQASSPEKDLGNDEIDLVQERLEAALLRSDGDILNEMVAPDTHIASNLRASFYAGRPE